MTKPQSPPPIRKPYLKFYGRDWLGDPALRMISPAARGVWIDLLCIMSMAVPYGHLTVHGAPMADDQAARVCGLPLAEYAALLASIEAAGVSSRTPDGVLYCRRLVRDHAYYASQADAGRRGGNPLLVTPHTPPNGEEKPETRSQKPEATVRLRVPLKPTLKGLASYKTWTAADLAEQAESANADRLLSESELAGFIAYWTEPRPSGKPRLTGEKAFDVRRRLQTWREVADKRKGGATGQSRNRPLINTWHAAGPSENDNAF